MRARQVTTLLAQALQEKGGGRLATSNRVGTASYASDERSVAASASMSSVGVGRRLSSPCNDSSDSGASIKSKLSSEPAHPAEHSSKSLCDVCREARRLERGAGTNATVSDGLMGEA